MRLGNAGGWGLVVQAGVWALGENHCGPLYRSDLGLDGWKLQVSETGIGIKLGLGLPLPGRMRRGIQADTQWRRVAVCEEERIFCGYVCFEQGVR